MEFDDCEAVSTKTDKIELPDYGRPPPYGGTTFSWWWFFNEPHKWVLIGLFLGNTTRQVFYRSQPLFLGILVGMVQKAVENGNIWPSVWFITAYTLVFFFISALIVIAIPAGRCFDLISKEISLFGFRHLLTLSEDWHESRASGEKLQRLLTARKSSFELLENYFWHMTQIPAMIFAVLASIIILDAPFYYLILFSAFIIVYVVASDRTSHWMAKRYKTYNQTLEDVVGGVYEFITSSATVRFFNLKSHILHRAGIKEMPNHISVVDRFVTVFKRWFLLDTIGLLWGVVIIALATYEVIDGTLSLAAYTTMIFMTATIWHEIENFAVLYTRVIEYWEGLKRLVEVLNKKPDIVDLPDAKDLTPETFSIAFQNVNFGYRDSTDAIQSFSLDIRAGEKVGLIGHSGAGKSTLVKLLLRFYDLDSGAIRIGGQDIKGATLSSLQETIAVIPQDVVLFNHPLMENIRYGNLAADDAAVIAAAKKAHADEFILDLPNGYDTLVGERGVKLSGGQRQRIAIARAILKDAPILVLDEATSALDSVSEKFIQDSLKELMTHKTVIAIAHRLSTISHLDRLVIMDEGRIVEQGSHAELLKQDGLYARLWAMQSGGFIGE